MFTIENEIKFVSGGHCVCFCTVEELIQSGSFSYPKIDEKFIGDRFVDDNACEAACKKRSGYIKHRCNLRSIFDETSVVEASDY